jgi:hypothetical protein
MDAHDSDLRSSASANDCERSQRVRQSPTDDGGGSTLGVLAPERMSSIIGSSGTLTTMDAMTEPS